MTRISELTPLQGTVLSLSLLYPLIKFISTELENKLNDKRKGMKFILGNYMLILTCSFLEEWKRLKGIGKNKEIQNTLKIASPCLNRIRKWKGLNKVRSIMLAHPFRDKYGLITVPWEVFTKHKCPTTYEEIILLGKCALLAIDVAYIRHHDEYLQALEQVSQERLQIETKGIRTKENIWIELNKISAKMLKIKKEIADE